MPTISSPANEAIPNNSLSLFFIRHKFNPIPIPTELILKKKKTKREREKEMGRRVAETKAGMFFAATLVLWMVSVCFEIGFNSRTELVPVLLGCAFFQAANCLLRLLASRDPLFVNTSVSLLHSTITSSSGPLSKLPLLLIIIWEEML